MPRAAQGPEVLGGMVQSRVSTRRGPGRSKRPMRLQLHAPPPPMHWAVCRCGWPKPDRRRHSRPEREGLFVRLEVATAGLGVGRHLRSLGDDQRDLDPVPVAVGIGRGPVGSDRQCGRAQGLRGVRAAAAVPAASRRRRRRCGPPVAISAGADLAAGAEADTLTALRRYGLFWMCRSGTGPSSSGFPNKPPGGAALLPFHLMAKPIGPVCNLDCGYCYYLHKDGLYGRGEDFRMREEVLEGYIRAYFAASPGPHVDFTWQGGEPTLMGLAFFRRAVALQQQLLPRGFTFANALQTNGTLLDDEWCGFLKEHRFLVGISMDGPPAIHDRYRQDKHGRPTHAAVLRGLRLLQQHQVEYNVLCAVSRANAAHPLEVYGYFRQLGVRWLQFIPIVERVGADTVSERSVPPEDYGAFLTATFDAWIRQDVGRVFVQIFEECATVWAGLPASLCVLRETCGRGLVMEHNGDVYACDHFVLPEYRLGNIATADLQAMVETPGHRAFGDAKRDALPRVCRRCDVRFICNGGCPKDRFVTAADGDPGLNYLCAGYQSFFRHADPYLRRVAALWRRGADPALIMPELRRAEEAGRRRTGRNDPCPCGSGKKYKQCCLGRHASDA